MSLTSTDQMIDRAPPPSDPPTRQVRGNLVRLLLAAVLFGSIWSYAFLLYFPIRTAALRSSGVILTAADFYVYWTGAHNLFVAGRDPYSPQMTAEIQRGFYGRPLTPADHDKDEHRFVYPLYVVFLAAPAVFLPYDRVEPLLYILNVVLLGASVFGWCYALGWKLQRVQMAALLLLALSSISVIDAFSAQQPVIAVAAALALAAASLARGSRTPAHPDPRWYALAGVFLTIATIKPHLSLFMVAWLLAWAALDLRRRGGLLLGFGLTLGCALVGSWILVPGWIQEWIQALISYSGYVQGLSTPQIWLPGPLAPVVLTGLGLALLAFLWRTRTALPPSPAFGLGLALVSLASVSFYPAYLAYNQVLLYPAAFLLLQQGAALRAMNRAARIVYIIAVDTLLWPWCAALLLLLALIGAGLLGNTTALLSIAAYWSLPWIPVFTPVALLLPIALLSIAAWRASAIPAPNMV